MTLFGSSGVRALVDARLVDVVFKIATAVGTKYPRVVVGCDTRTSSDLLKHIAIAGIGSSGARAFDAGMLPTPTLALAARKFDCGLMVTASHNPPEYNGVKLVNPDGSAFSPKQQREIEGLVSGSDLKIVGWENIENCSIYHGAIEQHIHYIRKRFPAKYGLKVVVDCACGAASNVTPNLLQAMGCKVLTLNSNPSGFFPHPVEPLEENLKDLMNAVSESNADLGVAHDGDADRMMAIDDKGRFISGDRMLFLLAEAIGATKMVTTIDASMAVEKQEYTVSRTRVGDSYVSEELKEGGDFGGEPSGAWIFPINTLCPDGIFAVACLIDIASKQRLSTLADLLVQYPIRRSSIHMANVNMGKIENQLVSAFKPLSINKVDGIKLILPDGWILVRPSGTEPKLRFTVEGVDQTWVQDISARAETILGNSL